MKFLILATEVRGEKSINACIRSPLACKLLDPEPIYGIANVDFEVRHPLSNRRLRIKKGDRFQVVKLEDIKARVRFVEGEAQAKGRSYVIDRMMLTLFE